MIDRLLLAWDRLLMRVTDEDELCLDFDEDGQRECVRRWGHGGRHVFRDLA